MLKALKALFDTSVRDDRSPHGRQLAAAALMIELGKADYDSDPAEQAVIVDAIRRCSGLRDDELAALIEDARTSSAQSTSLYEFTSLINQHYSVDEKFALIVELWRIAAADAEIHKYEDHLIRRIADLIYVPHSEFIRAKLQVINNDR
jgi:uncharacterized tellurite resistance protein B-like protein